MKELSNDQLVHKLVQLACNERQLLGEVLRHLQEVERRGLDTEMAYPSLYEFCVKELGYSEWEAHVRIQAMRLVKAVPEVERRLEAGEITLSVVAKAQKQFRRAEKRKQPVPDVKKAEILNLLCGSSAREAEKKLAEYFPEPLPPRETVRMLADGKVKIEFVVDRELWERLESLLRVRMHTNVEKRWDVFIGDMAKLAWRAWHPLGRVKELPGTSHVEVR